MSTCSLQRPGLALAELEQKLAAEGDQGQRLAEETEQLDAAPIRNNAGRQTAIRQMAQGIFPDDQIEAIKAEWQELDQEDITLELRIEELRKIQAPCRISGYES
jgi:hypothetical protein